jgi:anti-anti-sigma factor
VSDTEETGVRVEPLHGEIDVAALPELRRRLTALPNTLQELIVDLSAVTYMDSSGVRLLHELNDRLSVRSQRLIVVSPPGSAPRRVLDLTAFGERVALEDSLSSALVAARGGS